MRYRITIDRDALEKNPRDPEHKIRPIRIHDTRKGVDLKAVRGVGFPMGAELVYGDPKQDGARVWIECDGYIERS